MTNSTSFNPRNYTEREISSILWIHTLRLRKARGDTQNHDVSAVREVLWKRDVWGWHLLYMLQSEHVIARTEKAGLFSPPCKLFEGRDCTLSLYSQHLSIHLAHIFNDFISILFLELLITHFISQRIFGNGSINLCWMSAWKKVYWKWNSISKTTMERFEQMMTQEKYKSGSSGGNMDGS